MERTGKLLQGRLLSQLLWLCPLGCFLISISHATNIPLLDDYNLVLEFLTKFKELPSLGEKLKLLFTPVNNHLIITYYLMILFDYEIFKAVDFSHLNMGINLTYLLLTYVVYRLFRASGIEGYYLLPVILLLSVPVYNLLNWSSSWMHSFTTLFALLTILYFARGGPYYFVKASICAILAAVSSGGGMLVFLVGMPLLMEKRNSRYLYVWSLIFIIFLAIYFFNFKDDAPNLSFTLQTLLVYGVNFLVFFGTVFNSLYGDHHVWGILMGAVVVLINGWIIFYRRNFLKQHILLLSAICLALSFALLTTFMRSQLGLGATTAYRYRLYQFLPLIFIYLFFLQAKFEATVRIYPIIVIFSLLLYGLRMEDALREGPIKKRQLQMGMKIFQLTGADNQLSYNSTAKAAEILIKVEENEIYEIPSSGSPTEPLTTTQKRPQVPILKYNLAEFRDDPDFVLLSGWAYPPFFPNKNLQILLRVESSDETFYFPTARYLSSSNLMGYSDLSFLIIVKKSEVQLDWQQVSLGLALKHPVQGIIAEVDLERMKPPDSEK